MNTPDRKYGQAGFTLIELVIVTLIFGIIVSGALGFMNAQNQAFNRGTDQLVALQNLRYAFQLLEIDLTTLGSNVPDGQPSMVYGGDSVIAFTSDHTSNVANDVSAVYIDVDAPNGWVVAPNTPAIAIPGTQESWPDTAYQAGTVRSPAEFIMFFFFLDQTTARTDDYVLYRKVNRKEPEVVARKLLKLDNRPFFRYYQRKTFSSAPTQLDSIPDSRLPLFHSEKIHGSIGDTAASALTDSVRAVRVNFRSTNGRPGEQERFADVSRIIPLPNAGFATLRTCGDEPIMNEPLGAQVQMVLGEPKVVLTWDAVVDEAQGERDVIRYVVYRRLQGTGWQDPYLSIPAGATEYQYEDWDLQSGVVYEYAFAAQDCTPTLSSLSNTAQAVIP